MGTIQPGAIITLAIFVVGLIYHAGRHDARLDQVERELHTQRDELRSEIQELKAMVRAALGERRNWRDPDN